ncbi:hypothetical protein JCM10212_000377 [Sporobolomyces blumeae]
MATTTTTTRQWTVQKYSRSRHVQEPALKRQKIEVQDAAGGRRQQLEWDHFTQPRLCLRLESTHLSSPRTSFHSADADSQPSETLLLSILYDPVSAASSYSRASTRPPGLVLDSIDLLSFSSPIVRSVCPPNDLPIKAVYKDETVGLRYLETRGSESWSRSSRAVGGGVEWKRMQVKFDSMRDREAFMQCVKGIVPAKPAETNSEATADSTRLNAVQEQMRPVASVPNATRPALSDSSQPSSRIGSALPLAASTARPPRHRSIQLPSTLSSILPNVATASIDPSAPRPHSGLFDPTLTPSQALARMDRSEFERVLEEVLCEEGFDLLVERVQRTMLDG